MYCTRKITEDLTFIGGNDRRIALFENAYPVPRGVSYNSYFLDDEKTAVFDTVDKSVSTLFFNNLKKVLNGRKLDYIFVNHMEPDHAATLDELVLRYPDVKVVCNDKSLKMIKQFFDFETEGRCITVNEGDVISLGKHEITFVMAPMVHWPEAMVSYDTTDKVLFSADAFGTFGSLDGALFADEVNFDRDHLDEARRYYTNIVGKYGPQVLGLLKKAATLEIKYICPLHGYVWREDIGYYVEKYTKWASYEAEEKGVIIPYGSIYGNSELAAQIIATKLSEKGIKTEMYDVSAVHPSYIISDAFKYSHIIFVSSTYNAGIFVSMENLVHDFAAHNIRNKTIAFVENGSWAPTSGKLMKKCLEDIRGTVFIDETVSIKSALKEEQIKCIDSLVDAVAASVAGEGTAKKDDAAPAKKFVCKICGYEYEGDEVPDDYKCPLCKKGKEFFEEVK